MNLHRRRGREVLSAERVRKRQIQEADKREGGMLKRVRDTWTCISIIIVAAIEILLLLIIVTFVTTIL